MDENAQATVFNAMIFFVIMIIASTLIFVYSTDFGSGDVEEFEELDVYIDDAKSSFMHATVPSASYTLGAQKITRPPGSTKVQDMLLEELSVLDAGVDREVFREDWEKHVADVGKSLIKHGYHYALEARYVNATGRTSLVFVSDMADTVSSLEELESLLPDVDRMAKDWSQSMAPFSRPGEAEFTFVMWSD